TRSPDEFARGAKTISGFSIVLGVSALFISGTVALQLRGQETQRPAADALQRALHLADLYDWADAAPDFTEAENGFLASGDQRNALYARLGKIRANAATEPRALPEIAAQLAAELETNPLLQADKELRMFCLIVKGDIDGEINGAAMRQDWEQVQAL